MFCMLSKKIESKTYFFTLMWMSFSDEEEIKRLLKEKPFYKVPIEKPKIKHLNNVDMLVNFHFVMN